MPEHDPLVHRRATEKESMMGVSVSLLLIAGGAILAWAVSADTSGVDLQTVGVILMVVGVVGVLLSLVFWSSWGGFGTRRRAVESGPDGTVVREEQID
jgi:Na+/proline symporter